jgi:hypothetical protein
MLWLISSFILTNTSPLLAWLFFFREFCLVQLFG